MSAKKKYTAEVKASDWDGNGGEVVGYRWTIGYKSDPDKVGCELERLRKRDGRLYPEAIVEKARSPRSAMHKMFQWDDTEAARLYREEQARGVVRNLRVVVRYSDEEEVLRRVYVHVKADEKKPGGYMTVEEVAEEADKSVEVIMRAYQGLKEWRERYKELSSRLPVAFEAVEEALSEFEDKL